MFLASRERSGSKQEPIRCFSRAVRWPSLSNHTHSTRKTSLWWKVASLENRLQERDVYLLKDDRQIFVESKEAERGGGYKPGIFSAQCFVFKKFSSYSLFYCSVSRQTAQIGKRGHGGGGPSTIWFQRVNTKQIFITIEYIVYRASLNLLRGLVLEDR